MKQNKWSVYVYIMECNLKFNHYMVTYIQTANRLIKFFYLFHIVTNKKKQKGN